MELNQLDISIVIPVYNGEETLKLCLDAIQSLVIPEGMNIEILLINDGSTDRTKEIALSYPNVRIIDLEKNMGRMQARKNGVENAEYEDILLIDARIEVFKDLLVSISTISYQPLMAGYIELDKYKSDYDTILYLIRRKVYYPYYPQEKYSKELWISKENFLKAPKGTGCLMLKKELFLKCIPENSEKDASDDTAILKSIVFENDVKILKHTDLRVKYHSRSDSNVNSWINHRGKTFADHYLRFINKYSVAYFSFVLIFLYLIIFNPVRLVFAGVFLLLLAVLYLFEDGKDIIPIIKRLPILAFMFFLGTLEKLSKMIFEDKKIKS